MYWFIIPTTSCTVTTATRAYHLYVRYYMFMLAASYWKKPRPIGTANIDYLRHAPRCHQLEKVTLRTSSGEILRILSHLARICLFRGTFKYFNFQLDRVIISTCVYTLHLSLFVQGKCRRIQVCSRGCYRVTCIDYLVVITSLTSAPLQHVRENVITLLKWLSSNIVSRVTVLMWSLTLLFYFLFHLALFHILYFIYKVYLVDFICIDYSLLYIVLFCIIFIRFINLFILCLVIQVI